LLGTNEDYKAAMAQAKALAPVEPELAAISDEAIWVQESFRAAKQTAYATPVGPDEAAAREMAERRIALAGIRLAHLLNEALNGSN
jgi:hypothetical protein